MFIHLLLEGFAEGALGVAVDVIHTAAHLDDMQARASRSRTVLRQRVVSLDGGPVRSSAGRMASVDGAFRSRTVRAGDVVLVPGLFSQSARTVDLLLERADVVMAAARLAPLVDQGVTVAASCSATFVLAAAGLLDGRTATTSWWLAPELARRFPRVSLESDRMVVDEGTVVTAGATFAHADLVLAVLARTVSPALSRLAANYLLLDRRQSQAPYVVLEHLRADDEALRKLERFIAKNLDRQISIEELARVAHLSPRTLARRVREGLDMTPRELVHRMRVRKAIGLLETTRRSVDDIAAAVGYADAAAFRRVFRRYAGESPAHLRSRG